MVAAVSWASSSHDGSAEFKLSTSLHQGQANERGNRSQHPLRGAWCQAHIKIRRSFALTSAEVLTGTAN